MTHISAYISISMHILGLLCTYIAYFSFASLCKFLAYVVLLISCIFLHIFICIKWHIYPYAIICIFKFISAYLHLLCLSRPGRPISLINIQIAAGAQRQCFFRLVLLPLVLHGFAESLFRL